MKKILKRISALIVCIAIMLSLSTVAFAWNASPSSEVDMSLKLVGMMNVKIFQDSPYIANVSTVSTGELTGTTLYAYKFSGTGTSIGKNWPHQVGDGPYTEEQFQTYFDKTAITDCMAANEEEVAVYMLYDFGDPNSYEVQSNMRKLGIDDINLYYQLMAREAKISISAYAGGGTAHESAITAYYRYSDDWRTFAKSNSGRYVSRSTLESMGIAAPNENRYFFETKDSQKRLDGGDAFPGVYDESVQQYIDENETYSLPVWEDTNEDASWNIINPVPTCNIYSRWGTDFNKDTTYAEIKQIKDDVVTNLYGSNYTPGQWYGYTDDQVRYYDGLDIDDMIPPKNWEWNSIPYYVSKSGTTYSTTTASKSHLGYGEYVPAATTTYHEFYVPENQATEEQPSRFMTVMVRETGTMCGLDGCGHWHSVKVSGVSTTNVIRFEPELNDDSVVVDYGLSTEFSVDANDWVWTTDATNSSALPNIADIKITAGDRDDESGYTSSVAYGKYGTLEIVNWDNAWGDGNCIVRYTPKCIVNDTDVFYYKVYPNESDIYQPITAKITVVPASVVYYEDNFSSSDSADANYDSSLQYSGSWTSVDSSGTEVSATAVNGSQQLENSNYGYDLYYENNFGFSNGTAHKSSKGDTLTFTFKGTGCDIIMRTDANDGSVRYSATKSAILADGSKDSAETEVTSVHSVSCRNNNGETLYQLPVVSLRYDELAYYTVTVTGATSRSIYIDGIRVYNPLGEYNTAGADNDSMDAYYDQLEKYAVTAPVYNIMYNSQELDGSVGFLGVYNNWNEWYGTDKNIDGEEADFSSVLTIGPNNEIYLASGQSLVFNVANSNLSNLLFAIEAKALSGSTTMTVSVDGSTSAATAFNINSNTAMYYEYDINNSGIGESGKIRIENSGSSVLSITNLKFSKVLGTVGKVYYKFVDESGVPVSGVSVTLRDSAGNTVAQAVTDASGEFSYEPLNVGTYKAYIVTPDGKSSVGSRTISVSETSTGDNAVFTLRDVNLEIGSHPSIWYSPTVELTTTTASFTNFRTDTPAESYTLTYTFDGVAGGTGYISNRNYLKGTLTLIINADGTASFSFNGSGKTNDKAFSSNSGNFTVDISDNDLTVNFNEVLKLVTGYSNNNFKFTDITALMTNNSSFYLTAYEKANASITGEYGSAKAITVGEDAHFVVSDTATVSYTFVDESGAPVQGVTVSVDGKTAVSDSTGTVTITDIALGDQTVTFKTPSGKSSVAPRSFYFTPDLLSDSDTFTLTDFDLTIGSSPAVTADPSVSLTTKTATFENYQTSSDAGSYVIAYTFDGVSGGSGYIDKNSNITGTLTLTVNADGSATYAFNGTGKTNGKRFSSKSGSFTASVTDSVLSIDMNAVLKAVSGQSGKDFKFTDITKIILDGTSFSMTAYENAGAAGSSGDTAQITVGGSLTSDVVDVIEIESDETSETQTDFTAVADASFIEIIVSMIMRIFSFFASLI